MELMQGYKRTEVGSIPSDWDVVAIGSVADFSGGSQPPRSVFKYSESDEYIRLIQIRDYKSDDFLTYIPRHLARKFCSADDIMIGRYGPPIFQILRGIEGAYNVALIKTTPNDNILKSYLYLVLKQEKLFNLIEAMSRRTSGQTGVEMPALKGYLFPLPPKHEQHAIAEALSDVDTLIAGLEKLIAKKRDLKQAAMQQLLTGQTRLPGFSWEWTVKRLGDLAEMGSGGTPPSANTAYYGGDIPWVAIADMTGGGKYIAATERNLTALGLANSAAQMFPAGTVLYAMYASLGECSISTVPVTTSQAILGIRPKANLNPEFLYYLLTSWKLMVKGLGQQGTQANLNKGIVADFKISLPAFEEQASIASVLVDMDNELAALEARLAKTRELKQGMMQELLTGRTRLV